ncbi:hypothetical protein JG688_00008926 [Phytophthora aleatoria]|uniref:Uncharacterized protein n=1 Tax=Phytophthora aleatoria TaxID=2496075 RepID=A0A8J5M707_9STRA|nr:hypothetical protein JG688_00008926 [Phytophthora aleatoria]
MPPNGGDAAVTPVRSRPLLHYKDLGLGTQNRKVRFTCVHASENFIACGANNGSVYLYATSALSRSESDRASAKYHLVKTISPPSNDRVAVTCLSICPLQKRLVVGTMRGVVYAIQLSDYHKIGEKVEFSHDFHAGFPITCFLWDRRGARLFSACNAGLVCQTVLRAGVSAIFGSTDTELLLKEETGIVQLDLAKSERSYILMVSSQLRVLLLNLTAGDGSAVQIGTKARQGSYGACFFTSLNVEAIDPAKKREIKVFSGRPGRRIWVADPQSGTVSSTLKFSLSKNPSQFLRSPECAMEEGMFRNVFFISFFDRSTVSNAVYCFSGIQPRNLSINKLGRFQFVQDPSYAPQDVKDATTLLVSWNVGSSVLFFLDPFAVEIIEWHLDLGIIHDLKIVNETTLVVLHGDAPKVSLIQSCSADQFLQIYGSEDMKKAVELAVEFNLNDAFVLESLQSQWLAYLDTIGAKSGDYDELTSSLKALVDKTKALEEEYRGDMKQVQATISAWLNCFDPTAQHEGPEGSDDSIDNKSGLNVPATTTGFARGEALVDGDGLPLTRGDWNLVRTLVSIYFAIWAAGSKLHLHPLNLKDHADGEFCRLYESEMGITVTLEPRYQWDSDGDNSETESATAEEAEAFVAKYGVYINPDLAAEVCNLRQFTGALKIVLDEVVSSADMEETCDDIVSWISEKESGKAFSTLRERDSLCLLLHLLDILLKKCPQQTIELCVSKYPVLYPWNIEQALFGIELDWEAAEEGENGAREIYKPTTLAQTSKYFRYLVRLLEEKGNEAGKDAQVVSRCLELCFADSAVVGDLFEHEERSSRIAWVAALIRQPDRFTYNHSKCWKMFAENNAFSALMELTILSLRDEGDVAALKRGFSELSELVTLITKSNELVVLDAVFERVAVLPHSSEECLSKILIEDFFPRLPRFTMRPTNFFRMFRSITVSSSAKSTAPPALVLSSDSSLL